MADIVCLKTFTPHHSPTKILHLLLAATDVNRLHIVGHILPDGRKSRSMSFFLLDVGTIDVDCITFLLYIWIWICICYPRIPNYCCCVLYRVENAVGTNTINKCEISSAEIIHYFQCEQIERELCEIKSYLMPAQYRKIVLLTMQR